MAAANLPLLLFHVTFVLNHLLCHCLHQNLAGHLSKSRKEDIAANNKAKQDRTQVVNNMIDTIAHLEAGMKLKEQKEMFNAHHLPVPIQKKIPWLQTAPTNNPELPMDPPIDPETISTESSPTDEHDMYSPSASNADEVSDLMESAPTHTTKP
ncbi:hypothetical protein H0H87_002463 [Tephrocybe sp. NHM501043]|nr:hypothetical protein H0H87_002463 [Tephrocybe sp. NHM501043]